MQVYNSSVSEHHYEVFHVHTKVMENVVFVQKKGKIIQIQILHFSTANFKTSTCLSSFRTKINLVISPLLLQCMRGDKVREHKKNLMALIFPSLRTPV